MSNITVERRGNVAVVILDAPEVLNALSGDMVTELSASVDEVLAGDARALLLTGAGRAFCAGANLQGRDESPDDGKKKPAATTGSVLETHYYPLLNKLRHMDIPLVTAVNGVAAGVGMSFVRQNRSGPRRWRILLLASHYWLASCNGALDVG